MITVLQGQSLFDIAIQYTGNEKAAIDIARANRLDVTDELTAGMSIIIPDGIEKNRAIVDYYLAERIAPATGINTDMELDRVFDVELPEQLS
jgi:hypothetical protein